MRRANRQIDTAQRGRHKVSRAYSASPKKFWPSPSALPCGNGALSRSIGIYERAASTIVRLEPWLSALSRLTQ